jgi:hypothetical protein
MSDVDSGLYRLLRAQIGETASSRLLRLLETEPRLVRPIRDRVTRAELSLALTMSLYHDLCARVPEAQEYTDEVLASGARVTFDHGALRTVAWPAGALPPGEAAISRVLGPLGYVVAGTYPLPRLNMTGRAWAHAEFPETIAQFFVSELHPESFSSAFQSAVTRVLANSVDPLGPCDIGRLQCLERDGHLRWPCALSLLPYLVSCFARHHEALRWEDYQILQAESQEMAWIATEGNSFNHATDRVADIQATSALQRARGRSIKAGIEVSESGRIRQTAFRAATVERHFLKGDDWITQSVPGSFYEFIQRERLEGGGLDLSFDSSNATAIFQMTSR